MTPYEVLLSESQERMLLVAARGREDEVRRICEKWDLDVAVVGIVTGSGRWRVLSGEAGGGRPAGRPAHRGRPALRPADEAAPGARRRCTPSTRARSPSPATSARSLLELLARPTIASKEWVYDQYDHMVRLVGAVRPGGDAAVVRLATGHAAHAKKGLALSVGVNARWCFLDPHLGAMHAVAECARNISCVGGEPSPSPTASTSATPRSRRSCGSSPRRCAASSEACLALRHAGRVGERLALQRDRGAGHLPHADRRDGGPRRAGREDLRCRLPPGGRRHRARRRPEGRGGRERIPRRRARQGGGAPAGARRRPREGGAGGGAAGRERRPPLLRARLLRRGPGGDARRVAA